MKKLTTIIISVLLIWIYTFRGGIKTIVWTDTLQTTFMLISVLLSIYLITKSLDWSLIDFINSDELKSYSNIFVTESFLEKNKNVNFLQSQYHKGYESKADTLFSTSNATGCAKSG